MPDLKPLRYGEAEAALARRGAVLAPSHSWKDVTAEEHAASFTVAKSVGFDILRDLYQSLTAAQAAGTPYEQWAKTITPTLQAKGWWGVKPVIDPADGQVKPATLGTPRRLKTIYDANMRASAARGQWEQIQRVKDRRPYLMYLHFASRHPRVAHQAWNGIIRPVDDEFWDTHFTPNGYKCHCKTRQLSERDLDREGLVVSPPQRIKTTVYENERTGEVTQVPVGIDPAWAHNPGKVGRDVASAQMLAAKWADGPPEMVAAIESANRRQVLPGLAKGFGQWVDKWNGQLTEARAAEAARLPAVPILTTGERRVVGALSQTVLDGLATLKVQAAQGILSDQAAASIASLGNGPTTGALTVSDRALIHMLRDAKANRGAALSVAQVKQLPETLAAPKAVAWDSKAPALIYVFDTTPGAKGKVVVRIDMSDKVKTPAGRQTVTVNAITTAGLVQDSDLTERLADGSVRYLVLDGGI